MLDLLAVCQRIPPYYSVLVTRLKLISNVLSVYQRTCRIFHTSAYVGAIRRSVRGPLRIHYSTVVYVDIRPRGPAFCASLKHANVLFLYVRYTLDVRSR